MKRHLLFLWFSITSYLACNAGTLLTKVPHHQSWDEWRYRKVALVHVAGRDSFATDIHRYRRPTCGWHDSVGCQFIRKPFTPKTILNGHPKGGSVERSAPQPHTIRALNKHGLKPNIAAPTLCSSRQMLRSCSLPYQSSPFNVGT